MKNVRSYFGFQQKSVVFSNKRIYARFGPKDLRNMWTRSKYIFTPGCKLYIHV